LALLASAYSRRTISCISSVIRHHLHRDQSSDHALLCPAFRKISLIESKAKCCHPKIELLRDFAAGVYVSEDPSPGFSTMPYWFF
jgi:hypothetical protein